VAGQARRGVARLGKAWLGLAGSEVSADRLLRTENGEAQCLSVPFCALFTGVAAVIIALSLIPCSPPQFGKEPDCP